MNNHSISAIDGHLIVELSDIEYKSISIIHNNFLCTEVYKPNDVVTLYSPTKKSMRLSEKEPVEVIIDKIVTDYEGHVFIEVKDVKNNLFSSRISLKEFVTLLNT